jgi:hypothetical protein
MRALAAAAVVIGGGLAVAGCGSSHPKPTTQTAPGDGTLTAGLADSYFSYMADP